MEELPAKPLNAAVNAEIETQSEETPHIFISVDTPAPETKPVVESEQEVTSVTAEKETEKPVPMQTAQSVKPTTASFEPHNGDVRVVDGEPQFCGCPKDVHAKAVYQGRAWRI